MHAARLARAGAGLVRPARLALARAGRHLASDLSAAELRSRPPRARRCCTGSGTLAISPRRARLSATGCGLLFIRRWRTAALALH